jgi:hypothetical protein
MTSRVSAPRILLEAHYYDGGLRTRHLSRESRPAWCPSADKAMLETDSLESESDVVLCVDRVVHGEKRVAWVGVFLPAPDRQFGSRGNHLGVGLWLEEGLVLYYSVVIDALLKLADRFKSSHAIESLIDDVAKHEVVKQLSECVSVASEYEALVSMPADVNGRVWRGCLLGDLRSDGLVQKASAVLQWLELVQEPTVSRRILLVSRSLPVKRPVTDVVPDTSETVAELLQKMPAVVSRLREERAEWQARVSEATKRIESLETVRVGLIEQVDEAKRLSCALRGPATGYPASQHDPGVSRAELERVTRRILLEVLDRRLTLIEYGVIAAALLPLVLLGGVFLARALL